MFDFSLIFIFSSSYIAVVRYGSPHGGSNGEPFDDAVDLKLEPMTSCIGVELFWSSYLLLAVRFIYKEDNLSVPKVYHGVHGEPTKFSSTLLNEIFVMNAVERIDKIALYVGTRSLRGGGNLTRFVSGIQFHTTAGRTSQLYGSSKGDMYTESYKGFTLGYAKGRSGLLVDMLQFVWYNQGK
jgi:hypothetical protein